PHGATYELRPYTTNSMVAPPPLTEAEFAENESFWKDHANELQALISAVTPPLPQQKIGLRQQWMERMHIPYEKNDTAVFLANVYSRALNTWGVSAQRMGRLESAATHFDKAVQLAPDNVIADA